MFVSAEAQNAQKPDLFKRWPNLRVIIDCTHFKIQKPFNFQMQSNTWSAYKASNDLKYCVGISTFTGLSFLSQGFEGSVSDKEIILRSGLLDKLKPNESVMCDRGFDIEPELNAINVDTIMPPFLGDRESFSAAEIEEAQRIAEARIFVEIMMKRIKDFRILRGQIPNRLLPVMDDMVLICAVLTQFDPPIITKGKEAALSDDEDCE